MVTPNDIARVARLIDAQGIGEMLMHELQVRQ